MKKSLILFAIVAIFGSCKKEKSITPAHYTSSSSRMFVVDFQSVDPQGPFLGYNLYLNGNNLASPINVNVGDTIKVVTFDPLGKPYKLKCNLDNVNQYPNENFIYTDVTWTLIVN